VQKEVEMARVFICHEFTKVRNRIGEIIKKERPRYKVIGEAFGINGALDKIERLAEKPEIVIIHCPRPFSNEILDIIYICPGVKLLDAPEVVFNDLEPSFDEKAFRKLFRSVVFSQQ